MRQQPLPSRHAHAGGEHSSTCGPHRTPISITCLTPPRPGHRPVRAISADRAGRTTGTMPNPDVEQTKDRRVAGADAAAVPVARRHARRRSMRQRRGRDGRTVLAGGGPESCSWIPPDTDQPPYGTHGSGRLWMVRNLPRWLHTSVHSGQRRAGFAVRTLNAVASALRAGAGLGRLGRRHPGGAGIGTRRPIGVVVVVSPRLASGRTPWPLHPAGHSRCRGDTGRRTG
jgi:hypothetical protein